MSSAPQDVVTSKLISVATTPWQDFMPGVRSKPLWADEEQQGVVMLDRLDAGVSLDPHRHAGDELVYVIEGAMADEAGTLTDGVALARESIDSGAAKSKIDALRRLTNV